MMLKMVVKRGQMIVCLRALRLIEPTITSIYCTQTHWTRRETICLNYIRYLNLLVNDRNTFDIVRRNNSISAKKCNDSVDKTCDSTRTHQPLLMNSMEIEWFEERVVDKKGMITRRIASKYDSAKTTLRFNMPLEVYRHKLPKIKKVFAIDNLITPQKMYKIALSGTAIVWRGDYFNGTSLLARLKKYVNKLDKKNKRDNSSADFRQYRQKTSRIAQLQDMILVQLEDQYMLNLPRAPPCCVEACENAFRKPKKSAGPCLITLQLLLGFIGSNELQKKGVAIKQLGGRHIYPHFGVFPPTRNEHFNLLQSNRVLGLLPKECNVLYDIGVGSGVLSAILLHCGVVKEVIATDTSARAVECARDNLRNLGYSNKVTVERCSLFPCGESPKADLIICNPPWLPWKPHSLTDEAVYDEKNTMLRGFLIGARYSLALGGKIFLIISNLAVLLKLRQHGELTSWVSEGGLRIIHKESIKPKHNKINQENDPLRMVRSEEITSLYVLELDS